MPICNSPPATVNKKSNTDISADHVTEAAKVKRTREQAYFNSYDFDAIEVLPYEEADDDDDVQRTMSQQRLPVASSLSTQSNTSVPTTTTSNNSSRNSSGRYAKQLGVNAGGKYAYLQRLGTFFGRGSALPATAVVIDDAVDYNNEQMRDNATSTPNGNFLLPRAILKYHSVGSTNSMSLADISVHNGASAGACKSLQSGVNIATSVAPKMKAMTSVVSGMSNVNGGSKTRLSFNASTNNGRDSQTGFLTETEPVAAAALHAAIVTTTATANTTTTTMITAPALAATIPSAAALAPRQKKQSTSSSIATTTTSTNDSGVCDERENLPEKIAAQRATTIVASPTKIQKHTENVQHGRASSHQSHYSTDKSGSSGYYSSNVCSTYSLDEHIYCEPAIDVIADGNDKSSKSIGKVRPQLQLPRQAEAASKTPTPTTTTTIAKKTTTTTSAAIKTDTKSNSQREDMLAIGRHTRCKAGIGKNDDDNADADDDEAEADKVANKRIALVGTAELHGGHVAELHAAHYSEKLRILETSIENLDRHLKNFPSLSTQENVVSYMQGTQQQLPLDISEKLRAYNQLPTIMEGYDTSEQRRRHSWQQDIAADDSLLDIDLDSFLLVNERKHNNTRLKVKAKKGIANPSFLTDEQVEENNYKCAKYINSCPEDAYCVESDSGLSGILDQAPPSANDHYMKRYEDQLHFQNTRELLEDVRDKIRVLTRSRNELRDEQQKLGTSAELVPKELEGMIQTLKNELEAYLQRMNQHSELEIRQLCSGLVKNQHVVKIQKAFERRRSTLSLDTIGGGAGGVGSVDYDINAYEAVHDGMLLTKGGLMPLSVQQQVTTTIRCASDPNFKMKRKSITEIFPIADYYVETMDGVGVGVSNNINICDRVNSAPNVNHVAPHTEAQITQLQRNLSFHKPVLARFDGSVGSIGGVAKKPSAINSARKGISSAGGISSASASGSASGASGGGIGEADSITEWHRKKPSYWEMYYGTNRMHQALLGKQQRHGGMAISSTQPTMSYPSSRPESDFTLDLPRAEQLRLKMEKEKKFRQRCRYITTFLSLVFFLLTVVVVSLVLTRGKRMFGSMI